MLPWFEAEARDLPWRETRDPYRIWVSEVMLQQTRVETVREYYGPFLERFPDLPALAEASVDEVVGQWSGLGYYRRARLLHKGAQYVHRTLEGQLPSRASELLAVPGIGPYTAGAIASIAFDQPDPLVDGNVARVVSRLLAIEDPKAQPASAKGHWGYVEEVLAHGSPRILAQALMELGATVCTPRSPKCHACPLARSCAAKRDGLEAEIPAPKVKKKSPESDFVALALYWRDTLILERRAPEGILGGMWCLPLAELPAKATPAQVAAAATAHFGVEVEVLGRVGDEPVTHVFTHRIWRLWPWRVRARKAPAMGTRPGVHGRHLCEGELPEGGIPRLTRKLLEALEG